MVIKTPHKRVLFVRSLARLLLGGAVLVLALFSLWVKSPAQQANAATASTINFQARLMGSAGQLVADGNYHVEFKLYNASSSSGSSQGSCTGDAACLWTETRTTGNLVTVKNGYLTVNLGSVTPFPTTIKWDQDLWLTMNIGGAGGTATWDGEMSPRLKLTAVPYAFRAGQLAKLTGANTSTLDFATQTAARSILLPDENGTLCIQSSTSCGFASSSGSGSYIQNGTAIQANANFAIQSAAAGSVGGVIRGAASQTADLLKLQTNAATDVFRVDPNGNTTLGSINSSNLQTGAYAPAGKVFVTGSGAADVGLVVRGQASQTADLLQLQDSAGTILSKISSTGVLSVGLGGYGDAINFYNGFKIKTVTGGGLDIQGLPYVTVSNVSGVKVATFSSGYSGAAGLTLSPASDQIGLAVQGAASQTADLFQLQNSAGTVLSKFDAGGNLSVGTATSPTGGVATFNGNVGVGTNAPQQQLHINGPSPVIRISDSSQVSPAGVFEIQNSSDALTTYRGVLGVTAVAKLQVSNNQVTANNLGVQTTSAGAFTGTNLTYFPTSGNSFINNGGNVGIGTNAPAYKLDVNGVESRFYSQSAGHVGIHIVNTSVGGRDFRVASYADGVNPGSFRVRDDTVGADRLVIDASGNVGIGTTNPQQALTLGSARNFAVEMATPAAPTVTPTGTTGSTSYSYTVTALDGVGETVASAATTTTTGNATLSATNYNAISWTAITGASSYSVYRTASGGTPATTGKIGTVTTTSLNDTGLAASGTSPTATTAYVNKLSASGNSWLLGGNVGVGTSAPGYRLDVSGTAHFSGGATNGLQLYTTVGGYTGPAIISDGTQNLLLNPTGNTVLIGNNGSVYNTNLEIRQNGTNNPFSISNAAGNTAFLYVNSSGNVGIGTTSPATTLDVNGVINAATGFRIANAATAGNYLRGNGTNFVSSAIQAGDIPAGSGNYIQNTTTLQASSNFNISGNGIIGGYSQLGSGGAITTSSSGGLTLKLGRLTSTPSNATDAFIGIQDTGGPGGLAGDLILIPRSSTGISNAIRMFTGQTTPTERLTIDTNGNVGIGTTTPAYKLQVIGTVGTANFQAIKQTGFGYDPVTYKVIQFGELGAGKTISLGVDPASIAGSSFNGNGTEILLPNVINFLTPNSANTNFIKPLSINNGNVGIGNTTPQDKLYVAGGITLTYANSYNLRNSLDNYNIPILQMSGNELLIGNTGGSYLTNTRVQGGNGDVILEPNAAINAVVVKATSGNVGIGTNAPGGRLDVITAAGVASTVRIDSDTVGPFVGSVTNHSFSFITNNSRRMLIDASGNVGIGTVSPQQALTLGSTRNLATEMATPAAPTVTPTGTTGSTSYSYTVTALDGAGGETVASTATTTTTGNATLSATNYNAISWTAITGASSYSVYRTASGGTPATTGKIGTVTTTSLNDTGLAASGTSPTATTAYVNKLSASGNSWLLGGNVGIYTATPAAGLAVNATTLLGSANNSAYDIGAGRIAAGNSIYSYGSICSSNSIGDCAGSGGVVIRGDTTANTAATVNITTGTSFFNGGNVGIGTTTPTQKLEVYNGNIQATTGNFNTTTVSTPGAPTVAVNATAGNLNGTYYYTITFVTANGQSAYGTVSAAVAPASQQVNLSAIPTGPTGVVTARKIYRTTGSGASTGPFYLVTTISDNTTTTYTDNIADASLGVAASNIDTSGGMLQVNGSNILKVTTNSTFNTALGLSVLNANTTGDYNTGVGYQSLLSNTTGRFNTGLGKGTLQANTTGQQNIAIGVDALKANTTANNNVAIGAYSLQSNTTGYNNLAIGTSALQSNTTGFNNFALGTSALYTNTTGYNNTALGVSALQFNTTGYNNIAMGVSALQSNTTGYYNTAIGQNALISNSTGFYNTAIGSNALQANTTGNNNVALGSSALYFNTTGVSNTAIGGSTLYANTTGSNNTALGESALQQNTTGTQNTALGKSTLFANTTGYYNTALGYQSLQANTIGTGNTGLGMSALQANTTGANNTASGIQALFSNTTGAGNAALGISSLYSNTTGTGNTALGYLAGYTSVGTNANTTGNYNTFVGYNSGPGTSTQLTNATAIGNLAVVSASNSLVLGSINGVNGATSSVNVGIGTATPAAPLQVTTAAFIQEGALTNAAGVSLGMQGTAPRISLDNGSGAANVAGYQWNMDNYNNSFRLFTAGSTKLQVNSNGNVGIGTTTIGTNNKLIVNPYSFVDNLATAQINTNAATNKGLVVQGFASQTADLLQLQNSAGTVLSSFDAAGTLRATNNSYGFHYNDSGSLAGRLSIFSDAVSTVGGIFRGFSGQTADLLQLQNSAGTVLSKFGSDASLLVKPSADSTTAFQVQNSAGASFLTADSTNKIVTSYDHNIGTTFTPRLFSDSFESGNFVFWESVTTAGTGTAAVDCTVSRGGRCSAKFVEANSGNKAYALASLNSGSTVYARGYFQVTAASTPSTYGNLLMLWNSTAGDVASELDLARNNSTGVLCFTSSTQTGSVAPVCSATTLPLNTWARLELKVTLASGTNNSSYQIWKDGTSILSGTFTTGTVTSMDKLYLSDYNGGANTPAWTMYADDLSIDTISTNDSANLYVADSLRVAGTASLGKINVGANVLGTKFMVNKPVTGDWLAQAIISSPSTDKKPLVVQGFTGQIADLLQFQDSTGSILGAIKSNGYVGINNAGSSTVALLVQSDGTTDVAAVIKGGASQSADLLQIQDSAGTVLANVTAAGNINTTGVFSKGGTAGISATCTSTQALNGINVRGGIVTAGTCSTNAADIAENYKSNQTLMPGDVVAIDQAAPPRYVKRALAPYERGLLGVISTQPYRVLGDAEQGYPVALIGRVPVRVSGVGGPIHRGDYLTSSAEPGVAMKASRYGPVIGQALEDFSGTSGTILVFISPQYYTPSGTDLTQGGTGNFSSLNVSGTTTLKDLTVTGLITVQNIVVNGHVLSSSTAAPAIVKGTAAGRDALVSVEGTDTAGTITINVKAHQPTPQEASSGLAPEVLTQGELTTLTFHTPFELAPRVVITPTNDQAVGLPVYVVKTNDGFKLVIKQAATDGAQYRFDYIVVGAQPAPNL